MDEDFPTLLSSIPYGKSVRDWIAECKKIHPDFNAPTYISSQELNGLIVEFNLGLQEQYKARGHQELYMMDDTWAMKPSGNDSRTVDSDKAFMHCINGEFTYVDENEAVHTLNSSQMNVLFPFKKMSSKSMFQS